MSDLVSGSHGTLLQYMRLAGALHVFAILHFYNSEAVSLAFVLVVNSHALEVADVIDSDLHFHE